MGRLERMFGPRSEWDNGNERERVEAGRLKGGPGGGKKSGGGRASSPASPCRGGEREPRRTEKKDIVKGISGFVSIRCGGCGRVVNTCLHEKRTIFNCKSCGHPNPLESVTSIHMKCPRCSFTGNYRTNRKELELTMECVNCSWPVPMKRVRRGNYVPEVEA